MKPSEIYALPDIALPGHSRDIFGLMLNGWHCHIPEIGDEHYFELPDDSPLRIRIHTNPWIDYERVNTIGSLWMNDSPVMIFRHAGRGGHDQYDRFITDHEAYEKVIAYLKTFIPARPPEDVYDPEEDIADLNHFYGELMFDLIRNAKGRKK
jgi:hypothetical protein